jgi:sulfur carrier protein ThiS adenylyltransferase
LTRNSRQRDLVPPETLSNYPCVLVGVGAVGRQVALQLAAVGVTDLHLLDPDTVEVVNLAPQGYLEQDVGMSKVNCTRSMVQLYNPAVLTKCHASRFSRGYVDLEMPENAAVFCCVDSITDRKFVWESVKDFAAFFCDARVAAECVQVLASSRPRTEAYYPTSLFEQSEAYQGSCTAKMTIFQANVAAGLMIQQFSKFLRGIPTEPHVMLNLLAMEMVTYHAVPQ